MPEEEKKMPNGSFSPKGANMMGGTPNPDFDLLQGQAMPSRSSMNAATAASMEYSSPRSPAQFPKAAHFMQ